MGDAPVALYRAIAMLVCAIALFAPVGATLADTPARSQPEVAAPAGESDRDEAEPQPTGALIEAALALARVGRRDVVFDLGSGDGRLPVVAAHRFGAMGVGIEFDADVIAVGRKRAEAQSITDRTEFRQGDFYSADLSKATVVAFHQPPAHNVKLRPRFLALKPGTRVLGLQFGMGEWEPDERVSTEARQNAYLWVVPANVAGTWRVRLSEGRGPREFSLVITQQYQRIAGELQVPRAPAEPIRLGALHGDRVTFFVPGDPGDRSFFAQVAGDVMSGTMSDGVRAIRFRADRVTRQGG